MKITNVNFNNFLMDYNTVELPYLLIVFGQIADCLTTLNLYGCYDELNPLMKTILNISPQFYVVLKVVSAIVLVYMLSCIKSKSFKLGKYTLYVVLVLSLTPPMFNVLVWTGVIG